MPTAQPAYFPRFHWSWLTPNRHSVLKCNAATIRAARSESVAHDATVHVRLGVVTVVLHNSTSLFRACSLSAAHRLPLLPGEQQARAAATQHDTSGSDCCCCCGVSAGRRRVISHDTASLQLQLSLIAPRCLCSCCSAALLVLVLQLLLSIRARCRRCRVEVGVDSGSEGRLQS